MCVFRKNEELGQKVCSGWERFGECDGLKHAMGLTDSNNNLVSVSYSTKCGVVLPRIPVCLVIYPHSELWVVRQEVRRLDSLAFIPPLQEHQKQEQRRHSSMDNLMADPLLVYLREMSSMDWLEEERKTFTEVYREHPKNFGKIAKHLEGKTVKDCVKYYYLTKKNVNYKKLKMGKRKVDKTQRQRRMNSLLSAVRYFIAAGLHYFPAPLTCRV